MGLGTTVPYRYDLSSPSIASTSSTVLVPPTNNVEIENTNVKNELASENIDKVNLF